MCGYLSSNFLLYRQALCAKYLIYFVLFDLARMGGAFMEEQQRLEFFPVTIFSIVMGLSGLALAWQKAQHVLDLNLGLNFPLAGLSVGIFVILAVFYITKLVKHPNAVKAELKHPVKLSFFPAISISLILLGTVLLNIMPDLAKPVWWAGVVLQFILLLYVFSSWVNHEHFETAHVNPSWFIPAVGNVVVPIAGFSFGYVELSWFFFSIGILFWIVLLTIVFNRILFHNPIPPKLLPTMAILIAPPAVGFVAYTKMAGGLDHFGHFMYGAALFFTVFIATQIPKFVKLPFFLSWWAYSFPFASVTIATFIMFEQTKVIEYLYGAQFMLVVLSLLLALLSFKTIMAVIHGKICLPD